MDRGLIMDSPFPLQSTEVICAIPSSIFGSRVPKHQIHRIPSIMFDQTTFEVYVNEYFMTTTGYCDNC